MPKTIATHSGQFHADDLFAIIALSQVFRDLNLVRTRDPALLAQADMRVDVGAKYSPATGDFDHHFKDSPTRASGHPYAASGLVWAQYGPTLTAHYAELDTLLFEPLDMEDTGSMHSTMEDISVLVHDINPLWTENVVNTDKAFARARSQIEPLFAALLQNINSDMPPSIAVAAFKQSIMALYPTRTREVADANKLALDIVAAALAGTHTDTLLVSQIGLPASDVIHAAEKQASRRVNYIVTLGVDDTWYLTCVPVSSGSFVSRKQLPLAWAGARGADLARITGLADAVFCHPGRWIAGFKTQDSAMIAARMASMDTPAPARNI